MSPEFLTRIFAVLIVIFYSQLADAETTWKCSVHWVERPQIANSTQPMEFDGIITQKNMDEVEGFVDELDRKRPIYQVVRSPEEKLIAIRYDLDQGSKSKSSGFVVSVMVIEKQSGNFSQFSTVMGSLYVEMLSGHCAKEHS